MRQDPDDPSGVSGNPGQDKSINSARTRKANAAVSMRLGGATWHEIAVTLGYPTERQALIATEKALVKQLENNDDREKLRRLAGARLERLLRAIWHVAVDPDHPDQLIAVSKARDIIDRHAKLFGLDAPTEVVVHNPTTVELEAWVAKVVEFGQPAVEGYDIIAGEVLSQNPADDGEGEDEGGTVSA